MREVAEEIAPLIEVRKDLTDERAAMRSYGTAYSIYLNGGLIAAGPLANRSGIRLRRNCKNCKELQFSIADFES